MCSTFSCSTHWTPSEYFSPITWKWTNATGMNMRVRRFAERSSSRVPIASVLCIQPLRHERSSWTTRFGLCFPTPSSNCPCTSLPSPYEPIQQRITFLWSRQLALPIVYLRVDSEIDDHQILDAFTESGDSSNLCCTHLRLCTSSALVPLELLIHQEAYHEELQNSYIYALSTLTRSMYGLVVDDN